MSLQRIRRAPDTYWSTALKRLTTSASDVKDLFPDQINRDFLTAIANNSSTSLGYLTQPLLSGIAYVVAASKSSIILRSGLEVHPILYSLVVGEPSTGKSAALKCAVTEPISAADKVHNSIE